MPHFPNRLALVMFLFNQRGTGCLKVLRKLVQGYFLNMWTPNRWTPPCTLETEVHCTVKPWISMCSPSAPQLAEGFVCNGKEKRPGQEKMTHLMTAWLIIPFCNPAMKMKSFRESFSITRKPTYSVTGPLKQICCIQGRGSWDFKNSGLERRRFSRVRLMG